MTTKTEQRQTLKVHFMKNSSRLPLCGTLQRDRPLAVTSDPSKVTCRGCALMIPLSSIPKTKP